VNYTAGQIEALAAWHDDRASEINKRILTNAHFGTGESFYLERSRIADQHKLTARVLRQFVGDHAA
jgi:hypothetical protein